MEFTMAVGSVVCGVIALLFALILSISVVRKPAGNDLMQEIAGHVRKGAMAYLKRQY